MAYEGVLLRCPNHLNALQSMWRSSGSSPCFLQTYELFTLCQMWDSHLEKKTHFGVFYAWSPFISHSPRLMIVGEGWNVAWLVNQVSASSSPQQSVWYNNPNPNPHYCKCSKPPGDLEFCVWWSQQNHVIYKKHNIRCKQGVKDTSRLVILYTFIIVKKSPQNTILTSMCVYQKLDIPFSSVSQSSSFCHRAPIFHPKTIKNTSVSHTVALGDIFLHYHEHTHTHTHTLFILTESHTHTAPLPELITRAPKMWINPLLKIVPNKRTKSSCLSKVG